MAKQKRKGNQVPKEVLSREEVAKHKPDDQLSKLTAILGFGLNTAYDNALDDKATTVAGKTHQESKAANVDALPTPKKK